MVDHDHSLARGAQRLEQLHNGALGRGVHPLKWLIHKVDLRVLHQGAGQKGALLLAAGKLGNLAVGIVGHAHLGQRGQRGLAFARAGAAEPAQRAVAPHHHHIQHTGGEVPVHAATLGDIAHQVALIAVGTARDQHLPGGDRQQPQNRLDQRSLACAVGADNRHQRAGGDGQVHVPQRRAVAIGHSEVGHFNGRQHLRGGRRKDRRKDRRHGHSPLKPAVKAVTMVSMLWRTMPM